MNGNMSAADDHHVRERVMMMSKTPGKIAWVKWMQSEAKNRKLDSSKYPAVWYNSRKLKTNTNLNDRYCGFYF